MKNILMGVLFLSSLSVVAKNANEVMVTEAKISHGGKALALEIESDGNASTFQLFINVPGAKAKDVDLSRCLSNLPKTHTGGCVLKDGQIRLGAYSQSLAKLPAGVLQVGTVIVRGHDLSKAITLSDVELGDTSGMPIKTESKFAADK